MQIGGQGMIGEIPLAPSGDMVAGDDGHVTPSIRPLAHVGMVARIAEGKVHLFRNDFGDPPLAFADLPLHVVEGHRLETVGAGLLERAGAGMADRMVAHFVPGFGHGLPRLQKSAPVGTPRVDVERGAESVFGQNRQGFFELGPHSVVEGQGHGAFVSIVPGMELFAGH